MKNFKLINNLVGWLIFSIAAVVYTSTVEETASFWDCGEFIAVSYKLMVSHPPGAPLFMLLGRMFSFLALGDTSKVAFWVNMLSVLSSAMTILFLFWSIVLLVGKIYPKTQDGIFTRDQAIKIILAGIIGSLSYTFSDSFWFSAVEAEVYAMSSFFTAIVFWSMLRWELIEDQSKANRWLILISYIMGLSIGIHLLNLVTIPALALIFYFKKYSRITEWGIISTLAISGTIIFLIMSGIIPGLPSMAGNFEVFFVNTLGLPFSSGTIFFTVIFLSLLVYGIIYSQRKQKILLNSVLLSLSFILIGYSSYILIIIRSNFDTPIDENDPENIISFVSYLKREQYGDRPLVYGHTFMARRNGTKRNSPLYRKGEDKYEIYDYKIEPTYDNKDKMLFPRIYSKQNGHPQLYRKWMSLKEDQKPTMIDNLRYMFIYQIKHMYIRYFMWNFAGRDGDYKDAGWLAPWETNINAPEMLKRDKARSNFYMIPLLLGILGLFFQNAKDKKRFWIVMMLFFATGLGLVIYLNSPPVEPRERDYIYVGSFYAFTIWIGFSTIAIAEYLGKIFKNSLFSIIIAGGLCFGAPLVMARNGWDNHNRSNRFHSVDQARNMLSSCAPNAILFTGGDNDTFPLWYVQEVEGFRTDVRVVVLSYFSTDWYIKQMKRKVYKSDPLPIKMDMRIYERGKNDYIPLVEDPRVKGRSVKADVYIKLISQENPRVLVSLQDGSKTAKLISKNFILSVDKEKVQSLGFIPKSKEERIVNEIKWSLKAGRKAIFKNELALLDILVHNNWERPIYFNNTSANNINMDLRSYLHLEGIVYRLMPIKAQAQGGIGEINLDVMMENIKNFRFTGFDNPNTYNDEEYRKFALNQRNIFYRLAYQLYKEKREEEALTILNMAMEKIPDKTIMYNYFTPRYVELYHLLNEKEKAENIANILRTRSVDNLEYIINNDYQNDNLLQFSITVLNQLYYSYRNLETKIEQEIKEIEETQILIEDGDLARRLTELKEKRENYTNRAKEFSDLFRKYSPIINRN